MVLAPRAGANRYARMVELPKIERIQADIDDYARALHGSKANASALSMVAATQALATMIDDVGQTGIIEVETLTTAHRALMRDDPYERDQAGKLRAVQTWIGAVHRRQRSDRSCARQHDPASSRRDTPCGRPACLVARGAQRCLLRRPQRLPDR